MDELFEQLKAAPSVNKYVKSLTKCLTKSEDFKLDQKKSKISSSSSLSPRRDSIPPPPPSPTKGFTTKSTKVNKSRSMSPPKLNTSSGYQIKPFKVLINRKKCNSNGNTPLKYDDATKSVVSTIAAKKDSSFIEPLLKATQKLQKGKKIEKVTPTKAQQKHFTSPPADVETTKSKTSLKLGKKVTVKRCVVRLRRHNLKRLQNQKPQNKLKLEKIVKVEKEMTAKVQMENIAKVQMENIAKVQMENTAKVEKENAENVKAENTAKVEVENNRVEVEHNETPKTVHNNETSKADKRKMRKNKDSLSPKRGRPSNSPKESPKSKSGFFIKLNVSTNKTLGPKNAKKKLAEGKEKQGEKKERERVIKEKVMKKVAKPHKIQKSEMVGRILTTSRMKTTKFSRTQLIESFGKRTFQSRVRIERCRHPLMVIFDSTALAHKKKNKSKKCNLSVSFREQVEIFGCTDTDEQSDGQDDVEYTPKLSSSRKASVSTVHLTTAAAATTTTSAAAITATTTIASSTPLVRPARLKKIENGQVVDDIEFDASLFINSDDIKNAVIDDNSSSTPNETASARKRREKKSFSPLKNDAASSPRKEQFKLANEKLPPTGLRRFKIDDMDEDDDDDDDDCEYIVPTEFPERRTSRANSTNAAAESSSSYISAIDDGSSDIIKTRQSSEIITIADEVITNDEYQLQSPFLSRNMETDTTSEKVDAAILTTEIEKIPKLTRINRSPTPVNSGSKLDTDIAVNKDEDMDKIDEIKEAESNDILNTTNEQNVSLALFPDEHLQNYTENIIDNILKERIEVISGELELSAALGDPEMLDNSKVLGNSVQDANINS